MCICHVLQDAGQNIYIILARRLNIECFYQMLLAYSSNMVQGHVLYILGSHISGHILIKIKIESKINLQYECVLVYKCD